MSKGLIILIVVLVVLIAVVIALYFFGKRAQKRQQEQEAQLQAYKQTVSMLVIDKKRMKIKESGLPLKYANTHKDLQLCFLQV